MTTNNSNAISMLCGDEIFAGIVDLGTALCKFGTAGQETPRHIFKSSIGVKVNHPYSSLLIGDVSLRHIAEDVDVYKVFDGSNIIKDRLEAVLNYGLNSCMKATSSDCPLLFTDSNVEDLKSKVELLELCYEKFSTPAIYIGSSAMFSSFCAGRSTSLVIDAGASGITISPIVDGYVLRKSVVKNRRGGDWMDAYVKQDIEQKLFVNGNELIPWYHSKSPRTKHLKPTISFREYHLRDTVRDLKQWMCFVPYVPIANEVRHEFFTNRISIPPFELPDGTMVTQSDSLCSIPEKLFISPSNTSGNSKSSKRTKVENTSIDSDSLQDIVHSCISKCDVDIRRELLSNIVVVGGCSVVDGFVPRLNYELNELLSSSFKPKIVTLLPIERKNAAWIGGSILSICGSFQQLWLSKQEYEEHGESIIEKRFQS